MWDDVEMFHIDTFLPLIFSHLCGKMDKIRYRLVYNRQNTLNRQGTALVQVEAYLNQRKIYLKTNVYLKPECWSREGGTIFMPKHLAGQWRVNSNKFTVENLPCFYIPLTFPKACVTLKRV